MLLFLNVIAYAQGQSIQNEPTNLEYILKIGALVGVLFGGLTFAFTQIYNLYRKYNIEQEKETGETWKKLYDAKKEDYVEVLADKNRLEADKLRLEGVEQSLRERLKKQKKLTLRLIAKIEGDGTEFDESEEV